MIWTFPVANPRHLLITSGIRVFSSSLNFTSATEARLLNCDEVKSHRRDRRSTWTSDILVRVPTQFSTHQENVQNSIIWNTKNVLYPITSKYLRQNLKYTWKLQHSYHNILLQWVFSLYVNLTTKKPVPLWNHESNTLKEPPKSSLLFLDSYFLSQLYTIFYNLG